MFYIGDGVWKSGAEAQVSALAEHFGVPFVGSWGRGISTTHKLNCGRMDQAASALQPDLIVCIGMRHGGGGEAG